MVHDVGATALECGRENLFGFHSRLQRTATCVFGLRDSKYAELLITISLLPTKTTVPIKTSTQFRGLTTIPLPLSVHAPWVYAPVIGWPFSCCFPDELGLKSLKQTGFSGRELMVLQKGVTVHAQILITFGQAYQFGITWTLRLYLLFVCV
jgi:hypothetical protein